MKLTVMAAAVLLLGSTGAIAASPFDGTWKFDLASQAVSKKPEVYLLQGGTYTCSTCVPAYSVPADGAFHAVAGNPYRDEVAIKVVDAQTVVFTARKGGKVMNESTETVAADGATATYVFSDTSAPSGVAVTGHGAVRRAAPAPAGAHAISGSWLDTTAGDVTDAGLLVTMHLDGDTLKFATPTGVSYAAKLDGTPAPVAGDPGWTTVSLKRRDPATLFETDYRDGTVIGTYTYHLAADGRSIRVDADDILHGKQSAATIIKQ